jgi:hypothetical protein
MRLADALDRAWKPAFIFMPKDRSWNQIFNWLTKNKFGGKWVIPPQVSIKLIRP